MRKWPLIPTLIAALAVAVMIGLGIWQLQRKEEKEALLARYAASDNMSPTAFPSVPIAAQLPLYRKSSVMCIRITAWRSVSGSSASGEPGYAHLASCQTGGAEGPGAIVAAGWSNRPANPAWQGGLMAGIIAPDGENLIRLVATDKVRGLELLAKPSPANIPNNHLAYAIQWFLFALAAGVIFVVATVMRLREATIPKAEIQISEEP
jgi:surfeit locus 1 family protein